MPRISIIIPAYNIAEYLSRAIDSILSQTFSDFELILVDDGSTDNTGAVCDGYAALDSRVKVIHKENGGAPSARNAAMDISTGEYFYFMDGDDYAEPEMLSAMLARADETGAELVIAGFYIDTYDADGLCFSEIKQLPDAFYGDMGSFRSAATEMFDKNLLYTVWNKLYSAQRLKSINLRFLDTKMDDLPFNLDYIRDISSVAVIEKPYYHFLRARSDSETTAYYPYLFEKRQQEHRWMMDIYRHWGLADDAEAQEFLSRRYVERILGCIENVTGSAYKLPRREKIRNVGEMICCENTRESLKYCRPRTMLIRLTLIPIKHKWAYGAYAMGCVMSLARRHFTRAFAYLRSQR